MARGAGPVVHSDLAGGYAVSERFWEMRRGPTLMCRFRGPLNEAEFLFIENHFQVLPLAIFGGSGSIGECLQKTRVVPR